MKVTLLKDFPLREGEIILRRAIVKILFQSVPLRHQNQLYLRPQLSIT